MIRTDDILPVSEFKAHISEHLERLQQTGRPEMLTVNGRVKGVVLSPQAYQALVDDAELARTLRMIDRSVEQLSGGGGREAQAALESMIERLRVSSKHDISGHPAA